MMQMWRQNRAWRRGLASASMALFLLMNVGCGSKSEDSAKITPPEQLPQTASTASARPLNSEDALTALVKDAESRAHALTLFEKTKDRSVIPAILEIMRFSEFGMAPGLEPNEVESLRNLSGQALPAGDWAAWMEWMWREKDLEPHPGYPMLKRYYYGRLHNDFFAVLNPNLPSSIDRTEIIPRPELHVRNVPPLLNPKAVANRSIETNYLGTRDLVAGIEVNGEKRAYPLKLLVHHEIVNDTLGGKPVVISYNPMTRSAFAYEAGFPGSERFLFGYTGLLYRGDTLLIDGTSKSLWSSRAGAPVLGPALNEKEPKLKTVPVTISTWYVWRRTHFDTTVLSADTGHEIPYDGPNIYEPLHASEETGIPMIYRDQRLAMKEKVFGLVLNGEAVAYPYSEIEKTDIIYDVVGGKRVTIFAFHYRDEFRAYLSGDRHLVSTSSPYHVGDGQLYRYLDLGENEVSFGSENVAQVALERIPGEVTYWYAWQLWYPNTRIYKLSDAENVAAFYPGIHYEPKFPAVPEELEGPPEPQAQQ